MASDRSIRRYRRWYARLLRLYPRRYRERFGESMEQTFSDLCRERRDANRGLHGFALGTFAETSAAIIRENAVQIMQSKTLLRWVLITAALLLVPFLAMQFGWLVPDPGSSTPEEVAWGPLDFAVAGVLLLAVGLTYELATRQAADVAHRLAVGIAVGAALLLVWVNLAVGMIGDEGNPANLMYVGVLAVGLIGASIARFQARGMVYTLFAMALAQALVAVIALVAGFAPTLPLDAFFVALWVGSALLFRHASVASSPSR